MGRVETCLDKVLAFGLGNERLKLRGGEGVYEPGLGHDKEEDLGAGEGREFVCLIDASGSEEKELRTTWKGERGTQEGDEPFS